MCAAVSEQFISSPFSIRKDNFDKVYKKHHTHVLANRQMYQMNCNTFEHGHPDHAKIVLHHYFKEGKHKPDNYTNVYDK